MASHSESSILHLLVYNEKTRTQISTVLKRHNYLVSTASGLDDLLEQLVGKADDVVLVDSEAVVACSPRIYSEIKAVCQACRFILLFDQTHRAMIKEAMDLGVYGCIMEPYPDWEILTMVKHVLADLQPARKRKTSKKQNVLKP